MRISLALTILAVTILAGCSCSSPDRKVVDDRLVWVETGIVHDDVVIDLGYRSDPAANDQTVEPVAKITQNGTPVADAMVFSVLISANTGFEIGKEVATVYEASSDSNAAYYAQGKLHPPVTTSLCTVRFRIVLPNREQSLTRDVLIPVK